MSALADTPVETTALYTSPVQHPSPLCLEDRYLDFDARLGDRTISLTYWRDVRDTNLKAVQFGGVHFCLDSVQGDLPPLASVPVPLTSTRTGFFDENRIYPLYSVASFLSLSTLDLKDATLLEIGGGDGSICLGAHALGLARSVMVESDPFLMQVAIKNQYRYFDGRPNPPMALFQGSATSQILEELIRDPELQINPRNVIVFCNIGYWKANESWCNNSIVQRLLARLGEDLPAAIVLGGYNLGIKTQLQMTDIERQDIEPIKKFGYELVEESKATLNYRHDNKPWHFSFAMRRVP